MSLKLSGSTSKEKTSTTNSFNNLSKPVVPDWIDYTTQSLDRNIHRLGGADPGSLVAGLDPLQQRAIDSASRLGSDNRWFENIMGSGPPSVQAASLLDNLDAYKSPYLKDVVDSALADFDYSAGRTRAQQDLEIARQGAFGGSGAALARSMTEGELARGRASTSAGLRDQAFNRAADLSGADAERRQSASLANAQFAAQDAAMKGQLALNKLASDRSNIQLQAELGAARRDIEQKRLSAPYDLLDWQIAALDGLPTELFVGKQETGTSTGTSKTRGTSFGFEATHDFMAPK